jgi:hypothetical protein
VRPSANWPRAQLRAHELAKRQFEALAALAAWVARYDSGEWDDPPGKLALLYDLERVRELVRGHEPFSLDTTNRGLLNVSASEIRSAARSRGDSGVVPCGRLAAFEVPKAIGWSTACAGAKPESCYSLRG